MDKIFISFSSKDRTYVDTFLLASQDYPNLNLWASHKSSLSSGENFKNKIINEIESSDGAIIFVSNNSLISDFINGTELPEIFKRKLDNSSYKITLVFVNKCNINENEYLRNLQFINSVSTSLVDSTSNQIDNIIRDVFSSIISSPSKQRKSSKFQNALFMVLPLALVVVFVFNFIVNNDDLSQELNKESLTEADMSGAEDIGINIAEVNSACFSDEIVEIWDLNWLDTPVSIEDLPSVNCESKISGHVFYSKNLDLLPEDLTNSLVDTILLESTTECSAEFTNTYKFNSNETLFDYQLLFVQNLQLELELYCFSVFMPVNKEYFDSFTLDLINLDIEDYRVSNGMFLTNVLDLKTGECFNHPEWIYGDSVNRYSADLEKSGAYSVYCSSPHDMQVIKSFIYKPDMDLNTEQNEDLLMEKCTIYAEILLGGLEEVSSQRTNYGASFLDSYFFIDERKLREGAESNVLCLVGNSNVMDIKTDYDYFDLVDKKAFKREATESSFINVLNCTDQTIKAVNPSDEEYIMHDFIFEWNSYEANVSKLSFYYEDADYFVEMGYAPETGYEQGILNQWKSIQTMAPYAFDDSDELIVVATMELDNGEIYRDTCTFNLYLED